MKIRYFLAAAVTCVSLAMSAREAEEPMYMVLQMAGGQSKAVDIEQIDRLTFDDTSMNVGKKDSSSEKINISEIKGMEFSHNEKGAVGAISGEGSKFSFSSQSSVLSFDGKSGCQLAVYDSTGRLMLKYTSGDGRQSIDLKVLPQGIYAVSFDGRSFKFIKK